MKFDHFSPGVEVRYKNHYGYIRFVDDDHITVCIKEFPENKMRDVCLVIYPQNFNEVHLVKESEK